jgi:hypothetical protein
VLEIGFGSGLNIPFYLAGLKRVRAVDSAPAGRRRFVEHGPAPDERVAGCSDGSPHCSAARSAAAT